MAIDTAPSTVATSALQAIPFSSLIGGPLDAAISAQAQAAKTSWEFIQNVGLTTNPETQMEEAINVTFYYNKDGKMTKLLVPLLTIVPIPYIAVDEVDIKFKANISAASSSVSSTSEETNVGGSANVKTKVGWGPFSLSANINANYSSKKDSKASEESKYSVEYTMDVNVHASQSDMPAGMSSVLNILQQSITEGNREGSFILSSTLINEETLKGTNDFNFPINATIKDSNGLLVVGKKVEFTIPEEDGEDGKDSKVTFKNIDSATTDKSGIAKFTIKGEITGDAGDQVAESIPFTLKVTDTDLNYEGTLQVIGTVAGNDSNGDEDDPNATNDPKNGNQEEPPTGE
ncbi:DUF2589 domain-containing protein [Reichenbachiella versicolor]|uniref:DUF2589 domain-containing protein n=1 Tax=Reichenbachiella versicolor TaxID=1821036 RepID=UPI000D6E0DDA|nr:DUF2589 domain-containing protein [Reichenbachiella versicolor]